MKKSSFKIIAESMNAGKLGKFEPNLKHLDCRKVGIDEIKEVISEEFGKVKKAEDEKVKETHWGDTDLEHEIDWIKTLDIKEFVNPFKKQENKKKKGKKGKKK